MNISKFIIITCIYTYFIILYTIFFNLFLCDAHKCNWTQCLAYYLFSFFSHYIHFILLIMCFSLIYPLIHTLSNQYTFHSILISVVVVVFRERKYVTRVAVHNSWKQLLTQWCCMCVFVVRNVVSFHWHRKWL